VKKFRAFYIPDLDTPDGALKFNQVEIDNNLWFAYDDELKYEFSIPFMDDDWAVQQCIGMKDGNDIDIYEGDVIVFKHPETNTIRMDTVQYVSGCFIPDIWRTTGKNCTVVGNIFQQPDTINI